MAKKVFLASVIAPGLVPHVLKGEIKNDSYMLRHGISSINLDLYFDINAICELFSIQRWEAFKEHTHTHTNIYIYINELVSAVAGTFFGLASPIRIKHSVWSRLASCE